MIARPRSIIRTSPPSTGSNARPGITAFVMELVEGPTRADRLAVASPAGVGTSKSRALGAVEGGAPRHDPCGIHYDDRHVPFMKNVQVTIDESTLSRVDRVGKPLGLNRSAIVRAALRDWLRRQTVDAFERDWIAALEKRSDDASRAGLWRDAQAWGEE